jgi:hypothetical protein
MHTSETTLSTTEASRLIKRLCKHFSHKVDVKFDTSNGHVDFPLGECDMKATDSTLIFTVQADNEEKIQKIQKVISSHADQFARNESFDWQWL